VFNSDRLNDDYERHQRRFRLLTMDELDVLVVDSRVSRPRWYNGLLASIGEGLISAGKSLKQRNSGGYTTLTSQTYGD
jgi:hypothetical protein